MAVPDVPYRFEHQLEVPVPPAQVWEAIASAGGISAWMMPTEMEPRTGGSVVFHMGPEPDMTSRGRITAFEPPQRIVYEEDWARLVGEDGSGVTPLVTEFLVEARSGGSSVVKIVTSAFGVGADWEQEFFDEMGRGWAPMLDNLRLYLTHFPGQQVTPLFADATVAASPEAALDSVRTALGAGAVGDPVAANGLEGRVERLIERHVLVRLDPPIAGLLSVYSFGAESGSTVHVSGHLFADEAGRYVDTHQETWKAWLAEVSARAAAPANPGPG